MDSRFTLERYRIKINVEKKGRGKKEGPFCRCRHHRRICEHSRHKIEMKRDAVTLTA